MVIGKGRTLAIALLGVYSVLLLYFLYVGFDRASQAQHHEYAYNLKPSMIALYLPMGKDLHAWFFNFANFAAFLPYGIAIPRLFSTRLIRFLGVFLFCIVMLEAVQMVTFLGSFDIDDIILNTLGAMVGYAAQQWAPRSPNVRRDINNLVLMTILFAIGTTVVVAGTNHLMTEATRVEAGREVGINELPITGGSVAWDTGLISFAVGGQEVEPQINATSRQNPGTVTFTCPLDGKYLQLSGYAAIPDDVSVGEVTVTFTVDGKDVITSTYSVNENERSNNTGYFETDIQGARELTITINNEDHNLASNVLLWDIALTEIKK